MPTLLFPEFTPFTDQFTVRSAVPVTVATNCCTLPAPSVAVFGAIVTAMFEFGPTTCTLNGAEVAPPGLGFTTVIGTALPTCPSVGVPVASNCVGAMYVVASGAPASLTVDVGRKPVPLIVISNCMLTVRMAGVTPVITGIGFSTVTVTLADFVGSSTEVAVTVTVSGLGSVRGAV